MEKGKEKIIIRKYLVKSQKKKNSSKYIHNRMLQWNIKLRHQGMIDVR